MNINELLITKQDYISCLNIFPIEVKNALQQLLNDRFVWKTTAILSNINDGISDDTHRVLIQNNDIIQQEYTEDINSQLFNIGFSVSEVESIING